MCRACFNGRRTGVLRMGRMAHGPIQLTLGGYSGGSGELQSREHACSPCCCHVRVHCQSACPNCCGNRQLLAACLQSAYNIQPGATTVLIVLVGGPTLSHWPVNGKVGPSVTCGKPYVAPAPLNGLPALRVVVPAVLYWENTGPLSQQHCPVFCPMDATMPGKRAWGHPTSGIRILLVAFLGLQSWER